MPKAASTSEFTEPDPSQESDKIFDGFPESVKLHRGFMARQRAYVPIEHVRLLPLNVRSQVR
jgi:hypothetical protein